MTSLWEAVRGTPSVATFERFALALTMLYTLRAVRLQDGLVVRDAS